MNYIKRFNEIGIEDIAIVGGKNASLGEMIQHLGVKGVLIPAGFAITASAYDIHIQKNNLEGQIKKLLGPVKVDGDIDVLARAGAAVRDLIANAPLPEDLMQEITVSYQEMEKQYGANCDVAVRSSATAEDLPEASFAGQQETFLHVRGVSALLEKTRKAYASLFTNRAISYRMHHNFDHCAVSLSIGVQKMVRSDEASSGVLFTLDTESGFSDVIFINAAYGLGEMVVQGSVNPDEFYVHKLTLKAGYKPILKKRCGQKTQKMVYANDPDDDKKTKIISVPEENRIHYSLTDDEILSLARQALIIEEHYSVKKGRWCPMDIEWAKDGVDGKLYIVQARPETVHSRKGKETVLQEYVIDKKAIHALKPLALGRSVGHKIVSGPARVITSAHYMNSVLPGEILVTDMTDPDWEPIMKRAAGIVTNRGGRTCHAAIVCREIGIPAIIGTKDGTEKIKTGMIVTLDCSSGEVGAVYEGAIPFTEKKTQIDTLKKPPVSLMINLGNPDEAFALARLPVDGVGLARLEFIINTSIQIHPMALVHPEKITDASILESINQQTIAYHDKKQYFIDTLAQEAGTIAAAFYPKPVIIRMSDFKSNEYRSLVGGTFFEPQEENPMIGFRGASRYAHEAYKEAFALECAAMKKIRNEMGLTNVILMIPFVRTLGEARNVLVTMESFGLKRGENELQVYMMCEIPSNVLLLEQFSELFDGFSIGSNDLTQLTLAVDRDSTLIQNLFDERDPAVMMMLTMAIQKARKHDKKIGICGQAPSDYQELGAALIKEGISSLSLNPDSVLKTIISLNI